MIRIIRINLALSFYGNGASATYHEHPAGSVTREIKRVLCGMSGVSTGAVIESVRFLSRRKIVGFVY